MSRRPRLLMIVHARFPMDPRVARETRAAVKAGFEVDVIGLRGEGEPRVGDAEGATVMRVAIDHEHGAGPIRVAWEYVGFTIAAALRAAVRARRYDVVQVHNPPDFLIVASIVPRLFGARVVFDVHDLAPDMFYMRLGHLPGARLFESALHLIERNAARFADRVVTVHDQYRTELAARGIRREKIEVVMNTVDEALLPPRQDKSDGGQFRIVYHGTITPEYGVELLVHAVAKASHEMENFALELYGVGDSIPAAQQLARRLGLEDRFEVIRQLPHREVLERISGASVGVVPNLPTRLNRFALSTKLFEYVALKIPVVSADLPTLRAHFSDDEVRFFTAGDDRSLAEALTDVAENPEQAADRAERALARYEDYRWARNARRYVAMLNELAGRER